MTEVTTSAETQAQQVLLRSRVLSPDERLAAMLQAAANEERAAMCSSAQVALRKFYLSNAALLRQFATMPTRENQ